MKDEEIIETVRRIRRHLLYPTRPGHRAFAEGLTRRLEDAGVTEADLDRLWPMTHNPGERNGIRSTNA